MGIVKSILTLFEVCAYPFGSQEDEQAKLAKFHGVPYPITQDEEDVNLSLHARRISHDSLEPTSPREKQGDGDEERARRPGVPEMPTS